jgi:hypothetical protein
MEEFSRLCKEGKAISGIREEELDSLVQDLADDKLDYSNDTVIDMIIKDVLKNPTDEKLATILQNTKIGNIDNNGIVGIAYPKYIDDTYYIEIGEETERRIRLLSDVFAVLFMFNEKLCDTEYAILWNLLVATKNRYDVNEEFTDDFSMVQIYMIRYDKLYKNNFTDKYVAYSRKIHEMAMAFLVGHEIGHHYYGDTVIKPEPGLKSQMAELMADSFAIEFAFKYMGNAYPNDENLYGIHFFAGVYLPLIASAKICKNVSEDSENHPAIVKRLVGVQRGLKKILASEAWEETKRYRDCLMKLVEFPTQTGY